MIEEFIQETLEQSGVSVYQIKKNDKNSPHQYITWTMALEQSEIYADDQEQAQGYYIQVNIFSKIDYAELKRNVKSLMLASGFTMRDDRDGPYNENNRYFNRVQRYYYYKESE